MGLDQYAYVQTEETGEEGASLKFQWRKHAKLQVFMERVYVEKTGLCTDDLNCGRLDLDRDDIDALEQAVTEQHLPDCAGGFFFGTAMQNDQAEAYRDQDLAFCAWARGEIASGHKVIYSCWW